MTTSPLQQTLSLAGIASSPQAVDKVKVPYYVAIDMLNPAHDYQKLHYILMHFRAEKVSRRIWMVVVDPEEVALALQLLKRALSSQDRMIVAKAPVAETAQRRIAA